MEKNTDVLLNHGSLIFLFPLSFSIFSIGTLYSNSRSQLHMDDLKLGQLLIQQFILECKYFLKNPTPRFKFISSLGLKVVFNKILDERSGGSSAQA